MNVITRQELFNELFKRVRDAFVSSDEYGLDSYLSMQIRHGSLSGALRGQFERSGLLTRRSGNEYARNDQWCNLEDLTEEQRNLIAYQLARFSANVDNIIDDVRKNWMQVCLDERRSALFDYDFDEEQLRIAYNAIGAPGDVDVFLQRVLDELIARTRHNLVNIRNKISRDLHPKFSDGIDAP